MSTTTTRQQKLEGPSQEHLDLVEPIAKHMRKMFDKQGYLTKGQKIAFVMANLDDIVKPKLREALRDAFTVGKSAKRKRTTSPDVIDRARTLLTCGVLRRRKDLHCPYCGAHTGHKRTLGGHGNRRVDRHREVYCNSTCSNKHKAANLSTEDKASVARKSKITRDNWTDEQRRSFGQSVRDSHTRRTTKERAEIAAKKKATREAQPEEVKTRRAKRRSVATSHMWNTMSASQRAEIGNKHSEYKQNWWASADAHQLDTTRRNQSEARKSYFRSLTDSERESMFYDRQTRRFALKTVCVLGKTFTGLQGYEPNFLKWASVYYKKINLKRAVCGRGNVPVIRYTHNQEEKLYFPDFLVGTSTLVEVKSAWTAGLEKNTRSLEQTRAKMKGAAAAGFNIVLAVVDAGKNHVLLTRDPNFCVKKARESFARLKKSEEGSYAWV